MDDDVFADRKSGISAWPPPCKQGRLGTASSGGQFQPVKISRTPPEGLRIPNGLRKGRTSEEEVLK